MTDHAAITATMSTLDPLDAAAIDVTVDGFLATYRIAQVFRNDEPDPIEAVYTFPSPYGAVLVAVRADLAGKSLASVAVAKRSAENRYENAVSSGDSAILIEEVSPGMHCVNLGNLAPGETAKLEFTFGQFLEWSGDRLSIRIPTTIAPRYGAPNMREHAIPVVAMSLVRRADLRLVVRAPDAGWKVSSPTHAVNVTAEGADVVVVPSAGRIDMDRDVVVDLIGKCRPMALLTRDGDEFVIATSFQPAFAPRASSERRVLKVLVDRSGSMAGDSIAQARQALVAVLQSLTEEDHFAIVGFGSSVEITTEGVVAATPAEVSQAIELASAMEADLGGTEMRSALLKILALRVPREAASAVDVLLITDGESWDDQGIVAAARGSNHRIFAIGVGAAAAAPILHRLGEETGGACEIVTPREGMAERVIRQFARMDAQRLTGRVDWPSGALAIWPKSVGTLFAGDTVHSAAWFRQEPTGKVTFVAETDHGVAARQVIDLGPRLPIDAERIVVQVAAAGRIAETVNPSEAEALAVRYGLSTRYTHLVMVAERATKLGGLPELRRVGQMLAAGWMGSGSVSARISDLDAKFSLDDASPLSAPRDASPQRLVSSPSGVTAKRPKSLTLVRSSLLDRLLPLRRRREKLEAIDDFAKSLASANFDAVDLSWLQRAGAPSELCEDLKAFLSPDVRERDVVLALLHALVSAAGNGPLATNIVRRLRQGWLKFQVAQPKRGSELQAAVQAAASVYEWWNTIVRDWQPSGLG